MPPLVTLFMRRPTMPASLSALNVETTRLTSFSVPAPPVVATSSTSTDSASSIGEAA